MNAQEPVRRGAEPGSPGFPLFLSHFLRIWWKVSLVSLCIGVLTLLWTLRMPNIYRGRAVITPVSDENRQNAALTALASFGMMVGAPTKVEDLESLFGSYDLAVRVFGRNDLWPIVLGEGYDPKTGRMKQGALDRLLGREREPKAPGDWDAIRAAMRNLKVSVNRKAGTLSVFFDSPSPEGSAEIIRRFLEEAKTRLQEEALARSTRNKKFIEEQISQTQDPMIRDRLYSLLAQELEREMMAKNREQFGFRIVDVPRVPDRKVGPKRAVLSMIATILSFLVITVAYCSVLSYRLDPKTTRSDAFQDL